jgi:hypothetical protein
MYIDLLSTLSRSPKHKFRDALSSANVIWRVAVALVEIGGIHSTTNDFADVNGMVVGFVYLFNCLESTNSFTVEILMRYSSRSAHWRHPALYLLMFVSYFVSVVSCLAVFRCSTRSFCEIHVYK